MKPFFTYLKSELLGLFTSVPGTAYLVFQSMLIGCGMYLFSGSPGFNALTPGNVPADGLEIPADIFAALYRLCYVYYALLLPFVMTRLISRPGDHVILDVISRFSGSGRIFGPKLAAGLAFLAVSQALILPAIFYWHLLGRDVNVIGVSALFIGHFIYGIVILAVTIFCSSFTRNRSAALISAELVLFLPHLSNFTIKNGGMIVMRETVRPIPVPVIFENGYMSIDTACAWLALSALLILISYFRLIPARERMRPAAALTLMIAGMVAIMAVRGEVDIAITASSMGAGGAIRAVSLGDRADILAFYFGVVPLIAGFALFARVFPYSLKYPGRKKIVVSTGAWLVIIASLVLVQEFYIRKSNWKIFPGVSEVLPDWAAGLGEKYNAGNRGTRPSENTVNNEVSSVATNILHAGGDYGYLKNFFNKLTDLKAGRKDTVRIVHYGDSLIWGDCYSKTVKMRFQKEFGDGGRGIVPPVQTMSTALHGHINTTSANCFSIASIKHRFVANGRFQAKPDINPLVGFTGEGTFVTMPRSEIRLGVQNGLQKWNRLQVFLRSPGKRNGPARCWVNLDYGSGQDRQSVDLEQGGGAATFHIPAAESVSINFDGPLAEYPIVDAVNVETGKGIAYSTIIRMGIHMSWLCAVPDTNLVGLRTLGPDLVIFQFGINEAASLAGFTGFTEDILRSQMREWLAKIKLLLPETDFLLIGPPERLQSHQGLFVPMKETLAVRKVQREEAARAGMAFFDTYEQLGGEGHMMKLVNSGLAMNDYTHFTYRGGDFAADRFFDELMNSYLNKGGGRRADLTAGEHTGIRFNSISYLYFLAFVVLIGLVLAQKPGLRFAFLIAASYYFYATWKVWPLICLAATTVTDHAAGRLIGRARGRGERGTAFLVLSLVVDLGILFSLKYFDFFSGLTGGGLASAGIKVSTPVLNILMPAGISFYTFQSLSYTIDVWRGKMEPEKNFLRYAHYTSFFTQLLAGPIVKAREFLPALKDAASHFSVTRTHVAAAFFLILTGFVKKTGADWLAGTIVDRVFASPQMFMPLEILTAVYAYGLQIYGDFSGYTDIAIGSAMLLGFNLTENFRRPYASASVSEFWQRWHISLGSWLREYVYIGLGGNRKRVLLNIGVTMFVCGLWHGAAVPFVVWGLYHGFFLILERVIGLNKTSLKANRAARIIRVFITLHIVLFGWILFRSDSWATFTGILSSLAKWTAGAPNVGMLPVILIVAWYALHFTPVGWKERLRRRWTLLPAALQGCIASCITVFLYNAAAVQVKPFIYFQF
jgi:alginate O-acetyltransferase complex protein AlgI